MNACALAGAANDGARQAVAAARLRTVADRAVAPRAGRQNGEQTFDATVSNVLAEFPEARRFGSAAEKLCRASAGIQGSGLQCFVSRRVSVDVSVPLGAARSIHRSGFVTNLLEVERA